MQFELNCAKVIRRSGLSTSTTILLGTHVELFLNNMDAIETISHIQYLI